MKCSPDRLIEALIRAELMEMQRRNEAKRKQAEIHVVTVSRGFGSDGKNVACLLADSLEVRCCDRYILQQVAKRAHVDEELVKTLDEHVSRINGQWWRKLLHRENLSIEDYYRYLVKTVLSISRTGGVIVGRGANYILGPERAFRVRIHGSPEKCAARVAERDSISFEEAIDLVRTIDEERAAYIRRLYNVDVDDPQGYDLVLDSDEHDRVEMVEIILDHLATAGHRLPENAKANLDSLNAIRG